MRRPGRAFAVVVLLALAAACSKQDTANVAQSAKDAGQSVKAAVGKVANDPDVKRAGSDVKKLGHEAAQDIRKAGAEAKSAAQGIAADTHKAAHDGRQNASDGPKKRDDSSS